MQTNFQQGPQLQLLQGNAIEEKKKILDSLKGKEFVSLRELAEGASDVIMYFAPEQRRHRIAVNVEERTLRYFVTEKLLDTPLRRQGTAAVFGYKHILQILTVKTEQMRGAPLSRIKQKLSENDEEGLEKILLQDTSTKRQLSPEKKEEAEKALNARKNLEFVSIGALCKEAGRLIPLFVEDQERKTVSKVPDGGTIRYYSNLGLIDKPSEFRGTAGVFGYKHLLQILVLKFAQSMDKSLQEVREFLKDKDEKQLESVLLGKEPVGKEPASDRKSNQSAYYDKQTAEKGKEDATIWCRIRVSDDIELMINESEISCRELVNDDIMRKKIKDAALKHIQPLLRKPYSHTEDKTPEILPEK